MENIKQIISKNLIELRKRNKWTQAELAEKLNYSDKAISRWESGDTLPDIDMLCRICELYKVSFDYLTHDGTPKEKIKFSFKKELGNKLVITLLAISIVWFLATIVYVYAGIIGHKYLWQVFIWAIPFSCTVGLVFNAIWGKRIFSFAIVSFLIWSGLLAIYIQYLSYNLWLIFILGIPVQVAIILWSQIHSAKN